VTDSYGCFGGDTVTIAISPSPVVDLGSDTVICSGSSLVLDPGSQYSSYQWQDNSSFPVYTVTTTGYYSVTVTNVFNCPGSDEVFVEVTAPEISLGADTILCLGDTLYLDPGTGYSEYLWQDNSTQEVYAVTAGGTYTVTVTDSYSCTTQESVEVSGVPLPVADLGSDQVLCTGSGLMLETAEGPYSYTWDGQPGGNSKEVYAGGTYQVVVSNQCGSQTDEVTVTEVPVPDVSLGSDQVLQPGESLELDAGPGFDQYIWQDGSGDQYYLVQADQVDAGSAAYWVEVYNGPCKNSDTTHVEVFRVKVPNVITPNGDGLNDTFTPMSGNWSGISRHHMEVFNRWGEKVWETEDFETGWDGRNNGKLVAEGTYFWVLDVFFEGYDQPVRYKGTVTVLK
jgi:gliding motility-associated-like protein